MTHLYVKRNFKNLVLFVYINQIICALYWQESSMTSVGIKFRHNIWSSCLSGIIFSLINYPL